MNSQEVLAAADWGFETFTASTENLHMHIYLYSIWDNKIIFAHIAYK